MRNNVISKSTGPTTVIWVNFRGDSLSIDNDPYMERVTEVHCRCCKRPRPRIGAIELKDTWGYLCESCQAEINENPSARLPDHRSGLDESGKQILTS